MSGSTGSGCSTSTPLPGSPRSTCCSWCRWPAASCRVASSTRATFGQFRRRRHATWRGCRSTVPSPPIVAPADVVDAAERSLRSSAISATTASRRPTPRWRPRRATCTRSATSCSTCRSCCCLSVWPGARGSATAERSWSSRARVSRTRSRSTTTSCPGGGSRPVCWLRSRSRSTTSTRASSTTDRTADSRTSTPPTSPIARRPRPSPRRNGSRSTNRSVLDGAKVFLLGHGYAPVFTVRDGEGNVAFSGAVPALPQDPVFTSTTVVKVPDAQPEQLGFNVTVTPTAPDQVDPTTGPRSIFPEADDPRVYLGAWAGDLGLDTGVPQNVYELDTSAMEQLGREDLGGRRDVASCPATVGRSRSTASRSSPTCRWPTTRDAGWPLLAAGGRHDRDLALAAGATPTGMGARDGRRAGTYPRRGGRARPDRVGGPGRRGGCCGGCPARRIADDAEEQA